MCARCDLVVLTRRVVAPGVLYTRSALRREFERRRRGRRRAVLQRKVSGLRRAERVPETRTGGSGA
eukprot:425640-Rhodomonas_salina.1